MNYVPIIVVSYVAIAAIVISDWPLSTHSVARGLFWPWFMVAETMTLLQYKTVESIMSVQKLGEESE